MNQAILNGLRFCTLLSVSCYAAGQLLPAQEKSVEARIADRSFPSVFQAWNPADNLGEEDEIVTAARHDLIFHGAGFFGLTWANDNPGLAVAFKDGSMEQGLKKRRALLKLNPNIILVMEIRYRDAKRGFLPENHEWWKRDKNGKLVRGWEEGGYIQLDFSNPDYRAHVAQRAAAAVNSGVVDGIMLDWWHDDADHLSLVKALRNRIGNEALILVNANDRTTPKTAPFINGYFMECYRSRTVEDWKRIAETLTWAEKNLRPPRINCLETWYRTSRADENLMRATTALSLVLSDGYCLFSDPNPLDTPDHLHNWYPFWERTLGRALAPCVTRSDGAITREFTQGTAVYNPMGNKTATITFQEMRISRATGKRGFVHTVGVCDGDLFLEDDAARPTPAGDILKAATEE